jgi:hypothetical protein
LPVVAAMYFVWAAWSKDRVFTLYVTLLPVFYGYVIPGIATNILHKWRFKGPWVVGRYFAHHGFIYAANLCPLLFVCFLGTAVAPLSVGTMVRILVCMGGLYGFVAWIHDILMVKHGMVEIYNKPAAANRSPEEIATHYAPVCFFLIGLTYAASALLAFHVFVIQNKSDPTSIVWVSLTGIVLMSLIPSLAYRASEGK